MNKSQMIQGLGFEDWINGGGNHSVKKKQWGTLG